MKQIIVATDFSDCGNNAARYALQLAKALKANLVLANFASLQASYLSMPVTIDIGTVLDRAHEYLVNLQNVLNKEESEIKITVQVREAGFFSGLKAICKDMQPYLVVLGSQGYSDDPFKLGSNAVYAMKNLAWPLITVPAKFSFEPIQKIGMACDLNTTSVPAVQALQLFANEMGAEVCVLNAGEPGHYNSEAVFEAARISSLFNSVKTSYHFIESKNVDDDIIDYFQKEKVQLVAVMPRKYSFLKNLVHVSHTRHYIIYCGIPVLVLRS